MHNKDITINIKGISNINDELIPNKKLSAGTAKGLNVTAAPDTNNRLNRFAPIIFPIDRLLWPLISDVIAVTNSGRLVPSATIVIEITVSLTPNSLAKAEPLSTNSLAPKAMQAAPMIKNTTSKIVFLIDSFLTSSGLFKIFTDSSKSLTIDTTPSLIDKIPFLNR